MTSLCLSTSFLGHFMGKKSLEPPSPSLLGTAPHISMRDQRLQLSHDLLRILLQKKVLGMSLSGPAPHTQVSQARERLSQGCPWIQHWAYGVSAQPGCDRPTQESQQF